MESCRGSRPLLNLLLGIGLSSSTVRPPAARTPPATVLQNIFRVRKRDPVALGTQARSFFSIGSEVFRCKLASALTGARAGRVQIFGCSYMYETLRPRRVTPFLDRDTANFQGESHTPVCQTWRRRSSSMTQHLNIHHDLGIQKVVSLFKYWFVLAVQTDTPNSTPPLERSLHGFLLKISLDFSVLLCKNLLVFSLGKRFKIVR